MVHIYHKVSEILYLHISYLRLTFSIMQNYFEVKKFALEAQDKNLAEAMIETAKTHKHTCKQHKYHASQVTQIHWTL